VLYLSANTNFTITVRSSTLYTYFTLDNFAVFTLQLTVFNENSFLDEPIGELELPAPLLSATTQATSEWYALREPGQVGSVQSTNYVLFVQHFLFLSFVPCVVSSTLYASRDR
jgi:hypothetical protein